MSLLKSEIISSLSYNALPAIKENSNVPVDFHDDLAYLRRLLQKHSVPSSVGVRLVHKHFDTVDGEIMVFRTVEVPSVGTVQIMGPMQSHHGNHVRGLNYFVDHNGDLQAYEYTTSKGPNMSEYQTFLDEFAQFIVNRGLQMKWGLKVGGSGTDEEMGFSEFEVPEKRSTLMIPDGIGLPPFEYESDVVTDWYAAGVKPLALSRCTKTRSGQHHSTGGNCKSTRSGKHYQSKHAVDGLFLAGEKLETGSPIYNVVRTAIAVM